jgi:hypothetical protein
MTVRVKGQTKTVNSVDAKTRVTVGIPVTISANKRYKDAVAIASPGPRANARRNFGVLPAHQGFSVKMTLRRCTGSLQNHWRRRCDTCGSDTTIS